MQHSSHRLSHTRPLLQQLNTLLFYFRIIHCVLVAWNLPINTCDGLVFCRMWRIPNLHQNPTKSGTFWNPKSDGYLKSDHTGFWNCCFSPIYLLFIQLFLEITNSSTLIDGGLLCFLYIFENNHNYFNCSLPVRLKLFNFYSSRATFLT